MTITTEKGDKLMNPQITRERKVVVFTEDCAGLRVNGAVVKENQIAVLPNLQANKFILRGWAKEYHGKASEFKVLYEMMRELNEVDKETQEIIDSVNISDEIVTENNEQIPEPETEKQESDPEPEPISEPEPNPVIHDKKNKNKKKGG